MNTNPFHETARQWFAGIRYSEKQLADESRVSHGTLKAWQRPPGAPDAREPNPAQLDAAGYAIEQHAKKLQRIARAMRKEAAARRAPRKTLPRVMPDLLTCRVPGCGVKVPKGKPFAQHRREHRIADQGG